MITLVVAGLSLGMTGCQTSKQTSAQDRDRAPEAMGQLGTTLSQSDSARAGVLRSAALELLFQAAESSDPMLRANAIEALQHEPRYLESFARRALADPNRGVRFVATMTVGQQQVESLASLVEPLLRDESESVQAAAIYALHRCGREVDLNPLAALVMSEDPEIKANAAFVIGEIGNRSASSMLQQAAKAKMMRTSPARERIVQLQIAEALVKLGRDDNIEVIRAGLFSPSGMGEIRALAATILGRLKDHQYVGTLMDMATRTGTRQEAAEVRMAAASAVAMIRSDMAPVQIPTEFAGSRLPELRAQAAHSLGSMPTSGSLQTLAHLVEDQVPQVQVAAAEAVLRLTSQVGSASAGNRQRH